MTFDAALSQVQFNADGLVPAIIQDAGTHRVLMLGYMNAEAVRRIFTEGRVTFWSRSRQEFWRKGDTSGHIQLVRSAAFDCDLDALLLQVEQIGAACHTGAESCFDTHPVSDLVNTDVSVEDVAAE